MDKLVITRLQGKICTASVSDRKVTGIILEEEDQASILNNIYIPSYNNFIIIYTIHNQILSV